MTSAPHQTGCCSTSRRTFLSDFGMGFTGLALGAMLSDDGIVRASESAVWTPPDGDAQFVPRTRSVIWIFLSGGYSHLETFDPKPALNKYAGKTFEDTPLANPLDSPLHAKRFRSVAAQEVNVRDVYPIIYPMQVGWKQYGESGIEVTDWWPHLSKYVDDLCFVR
ncbi:MAG: DUF1501 domain-containing protein, partial [Planctomycetaceae bacterium]|nr:DUF1501 domain-containing protein [Planctomycetaceae bacterium]